jgi:hypothetical protein
MLFNHIAHVPGVEPKITAIDNGRHFGGNYHHIEENLVG